MTKFPLQIFAHNALDLENFATLKIIKRFDKQNFIEPTQSNKLKSLYPSKLYQPNLGGWLLFFVFGLFGECTLMGPFALLFHDLFDHRESVFLLFLFLGFGLLFLTEVVLIKEKKHFRSGITEAGIYSSFLFLSIGFLIDVPSSSLWHQVVLLSLCFVYALRYLDPLAQIALPPLLAWSLFSILYQLGSVFQAFIPIALALYFMALLVFLEKGSSKVPLFLTGSFLRLRMVSTLLFYLSANYFTVRTLSEELLGLHLEKGQDIPLAFVFYAFTVFCPLGYLLYGLFKRKIFWVRAGLLCTGLSVLVYKFYFSIAPFAISATLAGLGILLLCWILYRLLKKEPKGFHVQKDLFSPSEGSAEIQNMVMAASLNPNLPQAPNSPTGQGGEFGGGGSTGNW